MGKLTKKFVWILLCFFFMSIPCYSGDKSLVVVYSDNEYYRFPYENFSTSSIRTTHLLFDSLLRFDVNLEIKPKLVEKFEYIDNKTIRFFLKKNVKFHSGSELTVQDILYTFEIIKASDGFKKFFSLVDFIKPVDDYTFDVIMKKPSSLVTNSFTLFFPMEKDSGKMGYTSGTGPYTLVSQEENGDLQIKRNPEYWDDSNLGNIDRVFIRRIENDLDRNKMLLSGSADVIFSANKKFFPKNTISESFNFLTLDGMTYYGFQLNQGRVKAFKNKSVRLAVDYAIDRRELVNSFLSGQALPASQFSPIGYLGHNPSLEVRFDLAKARSLMRSAGYREGFDVSMFVQDKWEPLAKEIVTMLGKININVELTSYSVDEYWAEFDNRSADIFMMGWSSDTQDSANFWEYLVVCFNEETGDGIYNSAAFCDPEIDELISISGFILNPEKRRSMLQDIEKKLYESVAHVPLFWMNSIWASRKEIKLDDVITPMDYFYIESLVVD